METENNEIPTILVTKPKPQLDFMYKLPTQLFEINNVADETVDEDDLHPSKIIVLRTASREITTNSDYISNSDVGGRISSSSSIWDGRIGSVDKNIQLETNGRSISSEESDKLQPKEYFDFLDDYIRFDVARTGVSCFSGYSVSVQYEDEFLTGKYGTLCCKFVCSTKSRVRLWHREKAFELEYFPRISCTKPKNCKYHLKISGEISDVGAIHFKGDLVHIYNAFEKRTFFRRKQGTNCYSVKTETGERLASVDLFRGHRGDIMYYGLSILGEASSTDKALLIGLTIAMDIRQRESEMRCAVLWVPLFCVVVIGVFSLLPWLYLYDNTQNTN